jgi:hypothetical protein
MEQYYRCMCSRQVQDRHFATPVLQAFGWTCEPESDIGGVADILLVAVRCVCGGGGVDPHFHTWKDLSNGLTKIVCETVESPTFLLSLVFWERRRGGCGRE